MQTAMLELWKTSLLELAVTIYLFIYIVVGPLLKSIAIIIIVTVTKKLFSIYKVLL
jgi:hypothetical protein